MIVKHRDSKPHDETNALTMAGTKAEEQMAFYLKRAFAADPSILVFNDIRLGSDSNDDYAQLDHLILFPKGIIIIESKSVTTSVRINAAGEWSRLWNGRWQGMASPIQQAKLQGDFLRQLLHAHKLELREKMLLGTVQQGFRGMPIDLVVAISNDGNVEREIQCQEVVKADQVVDHVRKVIAGRDVSFVRWAFIDPKSDYWDSLTVDELQKIQAFLLARHCSSFTPTHREVTLPPAAVPKASEKVVLAEKPGSKCRYCQSVQLNITHGRYGYYFKCSDCGKNTPIDFDCPKCQKEARIRKERLTFFWNCQACGHNALFYTNAAE